MKKGIFTLILIGAWFLFANAAAIVGVTEVIDNGVNLLITEESGDKTNFDKEGSVLNVNGAFVFLTNNQGRQYRLDFTIITSPSVGSAELLRAAIDAFLQTGGAIPLPVGASTEAKQDVVIAELQDDTDQEIRFIQDDNGIIITQVRSVSQDDGTVIFTYFDFEGTAVAAPDEFYPVVGKYHLEKQLYKANKAGGGYSLGDDVVIYRLLQQVDAIITVAGELKYNETTQAVISIVAADLDIVQVSTEAKQTTGNNLLTNIDASLNSIEAEDFSTETTLLSVDSRLSIIGSSVATEATLQSVLLEVQEINASSTLPRESGFLGDGGLNTGSISPIGDFSVTPDDFFYEIPVGKTFLLKTLVIYIEDGNNSFESGDYGGITALTNGIDILVSINGVEASILAGVLIKKNTDFSKHGAPLIDITFGTGNESGASIVNTVELTGVMLPLNGDNVTPDRIIVRLSDNFTGLVDHSFKVLGPLIDN